MQPRVVSHTLKSLRALADPTRLRLMALLERDELSVNELQQISRLGQSRISTHLRQLQEAELLQSRREGKRTFYPLAPAPHPAAQDLIQMCVQRAEGMHDYPP